MRIVGGSLRGRPLATPADMATRPTSDRVREAIFNILAHGIADFELAGTRALDLFAGTGALGLEAISRGARFCLFVEEDAAARALIRQNIEAFGLTGITKIFRRDATDLGPLQGGAAYGLALLDPPYGRGLGEKALASAASGGWLAPNALCVLEERKGTDVDLPAGFVRADVRTWGDTTVAFLRYRPQQAG
ncbi:MAG: 16S rRNA (guanine(966)-N(2))-methyltransferase RsmD [Hyphomicrobiaceae bacterium]|nr:16S rRNA (guanine(966)-N(2))-methyltransferase RsmD [Hyphomicrobiaceae bacterium]